VDLSLNLALAPFQREASFHSIIVVAQSLGKALQLRNAVRGDLFEPFIELFPLSLAQHSSEGLNQFIRLSSLLISLREASQIVFLPSKALLFFTRDPMSDLQGSGRTLFLPFIGSDDGFRRGRNFLKTASLAFERSPRSDKAANSSGGASISSVFDLTIHLLGAATSLIPSSDEVLFVGIGQRLALPMNARPCWWLLHLQIGVHTLAADPHLVCNSGDSDFFGGEIVDLVRALDLLLMRIADSFLLAVYSSLYARGQMRELALEALASS